jgi:hypothetical protein
VSSQIAVKSGLGLTEQIVMAKITAMKIVEAVFEEKIIVKF